jgi:hypothetical protein
MRRGEARQKRPGSADRRMGRNDEQLPRKVLWAMCGSKVRYADDNEADRAAKRATRERGTPLSTYACPRCSGWHLTRRR